MPAEIDPKRALRVTRRSRIQDVAARAGVSISTVSRFFNNPGLLAASTTEAIRSAIADLDYIPNLAAGSLASKRSKLVSVFVPEISNSILGRTIEEMVDELSNDGFSVMLGITGTDDQRLPRLIESALGRRVDAIVLTGIVGDDKLRERLRRDPTPIVETWGLPDDPLDIAVGFSHQAVGEAVASFLMDRGYERPHLVVAQGPRSMRRRDGFVSRWTELGGKEPTETPVPIPIRFGQGRGAFRRIMAQPVRPDVVICGSDWQAQAIILEAQHAGLRVPDDIAVLGFGNLGVAGEMRPTISTVEIDGARIARETVRILAQRWQGQMSGVTKVDVGFRIVIRESA